MLQTQDANPGAQSPEVATLKIWEQTDGRLEQQDAKVQIATIRFAVDVLYIGPETAGTLLVSTAIADPNDVGNLATNVAAVTNSTTEILPVSCAVLGCSCAVLQLRLCAKPGSCCRLQCNA